MLEPEPEPESLAIIAIRKLEFAHLLSDVAPRVAESFGSGSGEPLRTWRDVRADAERTEVLLRERAAADRGLRRGRVVGLAVPMNSAYPEIAASSAVASFQRPADPADGDVGVEAFTAISGLCQTNPGYRSIPANAA